jgi:hypothetical protein
MRSQQREGARSSTHRKYVLRRGLPLVLGRGIQVSLETAEGPQGVATVDRRGRAAAHARRAAPRAPAPNRIRVRSQRALGIGLFVRNSFGLRRGTEALLIDCAERDPDLASVVLLAAIHAAVQADGKTTPSHEMGPAGGWNVTQKP